MKGKVEMKNLKRIDLDDFMRKLVSLTEAVDREEGQKRKPLTKRKGETDHD